MPKKLEILTLLDMNRMPSEELPNGGAAGHVSRDDLFIE